MSSFSIDHISAVTLSVLDMAESVTFYRKLGLDVAYGGPDAPFTSMRAGHGVINLRRAPTSPGNPWNRVILRVRGVDALRALLLSARTTVQAETSGAFDRLSPGDQKTARALFEAQSARARRRLDLDQIAGTKRNGETWDGVFRLMRAQGLVADRNLGQAVSRFYEVHRDGGRRGK